MLTYWKQAKQQFRFAHFFANGRNSHFLFAFTAFVFAGGVLNNQGRDNLRTPPPKKKIKKTTAHCPILAFRTNCSTLSWLRCAFFRLRLNFVIEPLSKEEICNLLSVAISQSQSHSNAWLLDFVVLRAHFF